MGRAPLIVLIIYALGECDENSPCTCVCVIRGRPALPCDESHDQVEAKVTHQLSRLDETVLQIHHHHHVPVLQPIPPLAFLLRHTQTQHVLPYTQSYLDSVLFLQHVNVTARMLPEHQFSCYSMLRNHFMSKLFVFIYINNCSVCGININNARVNDVSGIQPHIFLLRAFFMIFNLLFDCFYRRMPAQNIKLVLCNSTLLSVTINSAIVQQYTIALLHRGPTHSIGLQNIWDQAAKPERKKLNMLSHLPDVLF